MGPFYPGFSPLGSLTKDDPFQVSLKGIPKNLSSVETSIVWLNSQQLIYQNFLAGNFTQERYKSFQKGWKWTPDTTKTLQETHQVLCIYNTGI